jgi:Rrf2 family protein
MAVNYRFATAVHTLVLLASEPEELQTSIQIAEELNTNPVVIRRILASLHKADLVTSSKGPSGGSRLARAAKAITLGDIYRALENGPLFHLPKGGGSTIARIDAPLIKIFGSAQHSLEEALDQTSLAQILKRSARKTKR